MKGLRMNDVINTASSNVVSFSAQRSAAGLTNPLKQASLKTHAPGGLPFGFISVEQNIYAVETDEDGNDVEIHICSGLEVVGLCRSKEGRWGHVLHITDPDGQVHMVVLEAAQLVGAPANILKPLVEKGLWVAYGTSVKKHLVNLLQQWKPEARFERTGVLGCIDETFDTFAFADGTSVGKKSIVLDQHLNSVGKAMLARGSLEAWRENVARPCMGNPLMILALSQAFVGPLLGPLEMDGGGFHFLGTSSRGKSTLLGLAASVWGAPQFVQSWRATDNALEDVASTCSSALLALDEMHQVQPKIAGDIVYMLANGRGKQRMSSKGTSNGNSWRVAVLSSGEISLEDHMVTGNKTVQAGQEIRLLGISAVDRKFGAFDDLHGAADARIFSDKLKAATSTNYGHAGRCFVRSIIGKIGKLEAFEGFIKKFVDSVVADRDMQLEGQTLRALKKFATLALAGELATKYGITGWQGGVAIEAAKEMFGLWLESRDTASKTEVDACCEPTREWLIANQDKLKPAGTGKAGEVVGWRDQNWFYLLPATWAAIHGHDTAQSAARLHDAAGMLRSNAGPTLQWKMPRDCPGRPKVYAVRTSIFAAGS